MFDQGVGDTRDLGRHPEGFTQPGIAVLGELGMSAILPGLMGREVQSAELQELAVVIKAAQIAGLGQDRHGMDRCDPGDLSARG